MPNPCKTRHSEKSHPLPSNANLTPVERPADARRGSLAVVRTASHPRAGALASVGPSSGQSPLQRVRLGSERNRYSESGRRHRAGGCFLPASMPAGGRSLRARLRPCLASFAGAASALGVPLRRFAPCPHPCGRHPCRGPPSPRGASMPRDLHSPRSTRFDFYSVRRPRAQPSNGPLGPTIHGDVSPGIVPGNRTTCPR